MANSANYLLSKMSINMTVLEDSVRDLQNSIKLQIEYVRQVAVPKERKDEVEPMKERLIENLHIHLADADAELERVLRLRDTLPTPEEYAKVSGDHLVKKRFVLQLLFGALGTYMGTLTNQKYERLQESLTTTNIVQKKLIEVVNNQEQSIQRIQDTIERFTSLFNYLVILNPANLETAHRSAINRVKAEIDRIQNVLQIAQWICKFSIKRSFIGSISSLRSLGTATCLTYSIWSLMEFCKSLTDSSSTVMLIDILDNK